MTIHYEFLEAKPPCTRTHNAAKNVFLQKDITSELNNNIQIKLPLVFKIYGGLVGLSTLDVRLVPVKEIFMVNRNGALVATPHNRSYQRVDLKE